MLKFGFYGLHIHRCRWKEATATGVWVVYMLRPIGITNLAGGKKGSIINASCPPYLYYILFALQ